MSWCEVKHLPSPYAVVRHDWSCSSTPPLCLIGVGAENNIFRLDYRWYSVYTFVPLFLKLRYFFLWEKFPVL